MNSPAEGEFIGRQRDLLWLRMISVTEAHGRSIPSYARDIFRMPPLNAIYNYLSKFGSLYSTSREIRAICAKTYP
jgi:hypothetical protein